LSVKQDSNLYRYVGNSPTQQVDPSGLRTEIYVHSGHNWYGHTAININGQVYTFGRYAGAQVLKGTSGVKSEGYLYIVSEEYYLNANRFTDARDTIHRYNVDLTSQEERQAVQYFQNLFENESLSGRDSYLGRSGQSSRGHGRILNSNHTYDLTKNNCTTLTLDVLPSRIRNSIKDAMNAVESSSSDYGDYPPQISGPQRGPTHPQNAYFSPPSLDIVLSSGVSSLITQLSDIQPGNRKY
jgi:hypothetical protein